MPRHSCCEDNVMQLHDAPSTEHLCNLCQKGTISWGDWLPAEYDAAMNWNDLFEKVAFSIYYYYYTFYIMFHVKHLNLIMVLSPASLLFVDISLQYSCSSLFLQMIFRYLYLATGILPTSSIFPPNICTAFLSCLTLHQFLRIYKV